MLAQTTKNDAKFAQDGLDQPAYGGINNDFDATFIEQPASSSLERYLHERAVRHIKSDQKKNARALTDLADLHMRSGRYAKAAEYYSAALNIEPDNINLIQKQIKANLTREKYDTVELGYSKLIKLTEGSIRYLNNYLTYRIDYTLKHPEAQSESLDIFNLHSDNQNDIILNTIGLFYIVVLKDAARARNYFEQSLSINPDNIHANNNLGICYRLSGDLSRANRYFQKAHYLDLSYLSAYENLAASYSLAGNVLQAINILENAKDNKVDLSLEWQDNLALLYFESSQYDKALSQYKALLKSYPENNLILNNIGAIHERTQDINQAKDYFNKAIRIVRRAWKQGRPFSPRSILAFNNLARVLIRNNEFEDARQTIKLTHKIFTKTSDTYYIEALLYLRSSEYERAEALLKQSLELNPGQYEAALDLSFIQLDINQDYKAAIKTLESLEVPDNLRGARMLINNNLAYAYLREGKIDIAEKLLEPEDKSYASLTTKAYFHLLKDDLSRAEVLYKKALDAAKSNEKIKVNQFHNYELMEYWASKGDTARALLYAKKAKRFKSNPTVAKIVDTFISLSQ